MIVVHHLNQSRSHRILWLLEELALPYEIIFYTRNPVTRFAPPELKAIHPLGKSPVVTDNGRTIAESGAIIEYLIRTYGNGRLAPDPRSPAYDDYQHWLHFAEGSAMLPLMLALYVGRLGEAGAPLHPRIEAEIANHLSYLDASLQDRPFLLGTGLSGADIQMSFVAELANRLGKLRAYHHFSAWIDRLHARPAWAAAVTKGGPYDVGPTT